MLTPVDPRPRGEVLQVPLIVHGGGDTVRPLTTDTASRAVIDFSTAVNAFGPAPVVVDALRAVRPERYPDIRSVGAREAAARWWHRPADEIAFGAGVSELIHALAFAYLRPGDSVAVSTPAYEEYARASALSGARVLAVERGVDNARSPFDTLVDVMHARRPRLTFVCAPNNPTGCAAPWSSLRDVADAAADHGTLLVLDQSYDAFAERPLGTPALPDHPSVVHLRSITKDHALAGVRAGFALGPAAVIDALERARAPWSASAYAQAAAVAAMSAPASTHVGATTSALRRERERIAHALCQLGISTQPSDTHILLIAIGNAAAARQRLRATHQMLVRDATSFGLPDHIRVAARTPPENESLLTALRALQHGGDVASA